MRNTLPTLSIPLPASYSPTCTPSAMVDTPSQPIPTIHLVDATPSTLGPPSDATMSAIYNTFDLLSTSLPFAPRPSPVDDK